MNLKSYVKNIKKRLNNSIKNATPERFDNLILSCFE